MGAAAAPAPPAGIDELRALTRELLAHDAWPRERLVGHQRERLRATLRHAVVASPYYREVLGPDAGAPDVDLASPRASARRRASSRSARRTRCTSRARCSPRSGPGGTVCRS